MDASRLKPGMLIVSDTASRDPSTDKSGAALTDTFSSDGGDKWLAPMVKIVPDSVTEIQRAVQQWTDSEDYCNLIVTTGGTGFAVKDNTPEAISPLLHRHAPGLVHAMLAASLAVTPFASMSRPVAGTRHKTIIITLPGSPKGAKENLQAVLRLLPHACMQAAGGDSRSLHAGGVKKLESDAGVSSLPAVTSNGPSKGSDHHHHHQDHNHSHDHGTHQIPVRHTASSSTQSHLSNNPLLGARHRARESPYPILSISNALTLIHTHTPTLPTTSAPLSPSLLGATISADIHAREAVPAYRASIVDGYAIIAPLASGIYPLASISHARATTSVPPPLKSGEIARITTGAPLPDGANAVVMVEDTLPASATPDGREEATIEILTDRVQPGENVREAGSDIALDSLILPAGTRISATGGEIGLLAASGHATVPVYARPRVGVLSTGDEVVDVTTSASITEGVAAGTGTAATTTTTTTSPPLPTGSIRDSNRPSLLSLLSSYSLCSCIIDLGIAPDSPPESLETALRDGFKLHDLDVIVTTGGVSMGELDLLKPTVERRLGGEIHFGRVGMKPGKPSTFGTVSLKDGGSSGSGDGEGGSGKWSNGRGEGRQRLIFGLPGNPASALVTASLFVLPALQKMSGGGGDGVGLQRVRVKVAERVRCDSTRVEFHRVVVSVGAGVGVGSVGDDGGGDGDDDGGATLWARSTGMQRSSRVGSLAGANALLVLPMREGWVEMGESCEARMLGPVVGY